MRIAVTGSQGQVARALLERGQVYGIDVITVSRPELDLSRPWTVAPTLARAKPDVVVNAAAYTAVDQAEAEPDVAKVINHFGAGAVAQASAELGIPIVHLSTDYVFDGLLDRPYHELDAVAPTCAYGHSKLAGEIAVADATADHVILRTGWVYSPFRKNFVKTMLRVGREREELAVVADQRGSPTNALDLADGIVAICRELTRRPGDPTLRGVFHLAGHGEASWAEFAGSCFEISAGYGGPCSRVRAITTAEYPTPARRPLNSRLDCTKVAEVYGVVLAPWRWSLQQLMPRLLSLETTA